MASPEEIARRRRELNRRQSVRLAASATRRAVSELTPLQQKQLKEAGFTTRPVILRAPIVPERTFAGLALGLGTEKRSTGFATGPTGELTSSGGGLLRIARHEVAHQTIDLSDRRRNEGTRTVSTGGHHVAIRAAGAERGSVGLRAVPTTAFESPGRITARLARQKIAKRHTEFPRGFFETPHLRKAALEGSPKSRRRARQQMIRLGQRLKSRGIDF